VNVNGLRTAAGTTPSPVRSTVTESFREYRTAVEQSFVPLEVSRVGSRPFRGKLRGVEVDTIHVHEITASAHQVERTAELLSAEDSRFYKASLQISGYGMLIQDGREAILRPGDLAIYDTDRPYSLVFEADMRMLVLMFPREMLGLPAQFVGNLTAHCFTSGDGLGDITIPYLQNIGRDLERLGGMAGPRLLRSAVDLLATMFAVELDVEAEPHDGHELLVQSIRRYIDAHLGSSDLGPQQIAAAHYISTRHLHGLFRERGTTVSTWIRERRLEQCRRDLLDPLNAHRSVSTIAARWGFVEAAHFSRVFKAAYGAPPSELRLRLHAG
jgi:AraC-like DNA-binding protein